MDKLERLKEILKGYGKVAVAYSSGVDSTFLLKVASDVLGDNAIAVTCNSNFFPQFESTEAEDFCKTNNIKQVIANINVFEIDGICENPANRCYICKLGIFGNVKRIAAENGIDVVVDGSNKDDEGDYRPGMKALAELGVKSPLREAGLTKTEIREYSKQLGLNTWSKPAYACLASRIPYREEITAEKLLMVEKAEDFIRSKGFEQFRVRIHGKVARIEVQPADIDRMLSVELREEIYAELQGYGFDFVSLDMRGYRMGSLNETLSET